MDYSTEDEPQGGGNFGQRQLGVVAADEDVHGGEDGGQGEEEDEEDGDGAQGVRDIVGELEVEGVVWVGWHGGDRVGDARSQRFLTCMGHYGRCGI